VRPAGVSMTSPHVGSHGGDRKSATGSRSDTLIAMTESMPAATSPEIAVAVLTEAEITDLAQSWLSADPDMRFGKFRQQGQGLGLQVSRRHFFEAKRRIGITSRASPHGAYRRAGEVRSAKPGKSPVVRVRAPSKAGRRPRSRHRQRSINVVGLSNLVASLETLVAERDRARDALDNIRRIVAALR
jgi:hypothetical protein